MSKAARSAGSAASAAAVPTEPTNSAEQFALAKVVTLLGAIAAQQKRAPAGIAAAAPQMADLLEGRRRVAVNAVTHGVTGLKMFLSEDEFPYYMALARDFMFELRPATIRDVQLAQKIIDNNWRQNRISALENNMMVTGLIKRSKDHVQNDRGSQEMISGVLAYEADCSGPNAFDKLGRHEVRLVRMGNQLEAAYERRQSRLSRRRSLTEPPVFDPDTNEAYLWYYAMAIVGRDLAAARKELAEARQASAAAASDQTPIPEPATPSESATSEGHLFCAERPSAPPAGLPKLSDFCVRIVGCAIENNLLPEEEVLLFEKLTAA